MQAHKLEVLVIDFDQLGAEGVKDAICTARYPNRCISPSVEAIQTVEIGPWSDDHPLNNSKTCEAEYKRLFERTTSPDRQGCCAHDSDCAVHNAPALPVGPCDCSLAAAAPHAQAPAEQQESIDTPEFRERLQRLFDTKDHVLAYEEHRKKFIAHIDAHTAAAVAKARQEGYQLAHDDLRETQADWTARARKAEKALAQANAAEAKLEAIRQGVRECVGFGFDKDGPNWISRQQVLSLFQQQPQADESGLPG